MVLSRPVLGKLDGHFRIHSIKREPYFHDARLGAPRVALPIGWTFCVSGQLRAKWKLKVPHADYGARVFHEASDPRELSVEDPMVGMARIWHSRFWYIGERSVDCNFGYIEQHVGSK